MAHCSVLEDSHTYYYQLINYIKIIIVTQCNDIQLNAFLLQGVLFFNSLAPREFLSSQQARMITIANPVQTLHSGEVCKVHNLYSMREEFSPVNISIS